MIYFVIGLVIGLVIGKLYFGMRIRQKASGILRETNEGGDHYLFLELKTKPDIIMSKKYAIFKVSTDDGTWIDAPHD